MTTPSYLGCYVARRGLHFGQKGKTLVEAKAGLSMHGMRNHADATVSLPCSRLYVPELGGRRTRFTSFGLLL